MSTLADEALGKDMKGRRWKVYQNSGVTKTWWALAWFDETRQEWRPEQYAPNYATREDALTSYYRHWAIPRPEPLEDADAV